MTWLSPEVFIAAATLSTALITLYRMTQLEKNTNSKMDALLTLKGEASEAIGNLQGRSELRQENRAEVNEMDAMARMAEKHTPMTEGATKKKELAKKSKDRKKTP